MEAGGANVLLQKCTWHIWWRTKPVSVAEMKEQWRRVVGREIKDWLEKIITQPYRLLEELYTDTRFVLLLSLLIWSVGWVVVILVWLALFCMFSCSGSNTWKILTPRLTTLVHATPLKCSAHSEIYIVQVRVGMARMMPLEFMALFEYIDYFIVFVITSPRLNIRVTGFHSLFFLLHS